MNRPRVILQLKVLKDIKPVEVGKRFAFGGACSLAAYGVAHHYGPVIGGLFMAFPAIFPATASLVEKHHREHVDAEGPGHDGKTAGRLAAAVDAEGTALGCLGLMAFAVVVWLELPAHRAAMVLVDSMLAWLLVAGTGWSLFGGRIEEDAGTE